MKTVIFACVHSAGRSQMAAAWFNALVDPARARALGAGTQPAEQIHPVVVNVMNEVGIDLSSAKPELLTGKLLSEASVLVTMGCGEHCPVTPRWVRHADWELADPKDKSIEEVRAIRDEIRRRVVAFLEEHDWSRSR